MLIWYCLQREDANSYILERVHERKVNEMTMTMKAINELMQLRCSQVEIFGQPVTLPNKADDLEIDAINILKDMAEYELDWYDFTYYTEDEDGNEIEVDIFDGCETSEDMLDALEEYGYIEDTYFAADNSYNWSAPVSNDFDFKVYKDFVFGGVFVDFMVHRFGDVRGNYTDSVIYHFDSVDEFYETLANCNKYVQVGNYEVEINIFNDGFDIYDSEGSYIVTTYERDYDGIVEAIKDAEAE